MGWTGWHRLRKEGLIRDDIMLAQLCHRGAVAGQHTPRSIREIAGKGRDWLGGAVSSALGEVHEEIGEPCLGNESGRRHCFSVP